MSIWNDIQSIDNKVKSGELDMSGRLQLPTKGEAFLFHIDLDNKEGRNYIVFYFTLPGVDDYRKFDIRCPSGSDSDNSQYMAIQNIYNTLYGAMKLDSKVVLVEDAYKKVSELLKTKSIKVKYECEESKYIAQKGAKAGQEVTAIFLRSISGLGTTTKMNVEIKKKETAVNAASWEMATEDVPF